MSSKQPSPHSKPTYPSPLLSGLMLSAGNASNLTVPNLLLPELPKPDPRTFAPFESDTLASQLPKPPVEPKISEDTKARDSFDTAPEKAPEKAPKETFEETPEEASQNGYADSRYADSRHTNGRHINDRHTNGRHINDRHTNDRHINDRHVNGRTESEAKNDAKNRIRQENRAAVSSAPPTKQAIQTAQPLSDASLTQPIGVFETSEEKPRSGSKWMLLSIVLGLIAIGGSIGYALVLRQPSSEVASIQTAPVETTTLETQVDASGTVELGDQQTIKAPGDVIVEDVLVDDQARVQKGQVLLEIRDRTLKQQIADQMLQEEIDRLELERNQVLLMQQAVVLRNAQERLAESRSLLEDGFISQSDYEQDQNLLAEAQAKLDTTEIDVRQADVTLLKSETTLATLESQRSDNQIRAPFDAIVLKINVQPGDGVSTEKPLLTLGNPGQEVIRFELSTLDAQAVDVNMPVRVSVIGPDAKKYTGRVIWIAPQAISNSEEADQDQPKVEAKAVLDQPSGELIPGSKVSVEIITAQRQSVRSVPLSALVPEGDPSAGGQWFVWVKDAQGNAQKRAVTLGLQTLDAVEIVSGINADDEVVVSPPTDGSLTSGMPINASGE